MAEDRDLPGWPKKRLVREVRSHLRSYGITPKGEAWRVTWAWASAIANSYYYTHWPLPAEISTQYVLLLVAEMKQRQFLKLPFRANTVVPDDVGRLLSVDSVPKLTDKRGSVRVDEIGPDKKFVADTREDGGCHRNQTTYGAQHEEISRGDKTTGDLPA
jgi:hypothetical protein